ncbi:hypothetical protein ARTHROSP310_29720 [Arthrobacter sp. AD-310]
MNPTRAVTIPAATGRDVSVVDWTGRGVVDGAGDFGITAGYRRARAGKESGREGIGWGRNRD